MNMKTMQQAVLVLALALPLCACAAQPQPLSSMHTLTGTADSSGRGGADCEDMFDRQPAGMELRLSAGGVQLPVLPIFW